MIGAQKDYHEYFKCEWNLVTSLWATTHCQCAAVYAHVQIQRAPNWQYDATLKDLARTADTSSVRVSKLFIRMNISTQKQKC